MNEIPATSPAPRRDDGQADPAWTCPFCSLLCDGLPMPVAQADGSLALASGAAADNGLGEDAARRHGDCSRAARALAKTGVTAPASVNGRPVAHAAALAEAARLLSRARRPLFGGLATDVAGIRALYRLANDCGAVFDHAHGGAVTAGLRAVQDRGSFTTTLAEIRNRADLIVCFGVQPAAKAPAFYQRCGLADPGPRELCFIGTAVDPAAAALPNLDCQSLGCDGDLATTIHWLNALSRARPWPGAATAPETWRRLAARLASARYAVLVWSPAELVATHGEAGAALLIEGLQQLVKALNRSTRAGGLALGGDDGSATAAQTLTWLSGLPLRTEVRRDRLDHDPQRFAWQRLLARHEVDLLLWVSSFTDSLVPPETDLPTLVIGHPGLADSMRDRAGVFLPAAAPGIDSPGHLFRTDGGIVLPLRPARAAPPAPLPSVAATVTALVAEVGSRLGVGPASLAEGGPT